MRVTKTKISHEGALWLACASDTCWSRRTMWGEEDSHQFKRVTNRRWDNLPYRVLSSEDPFIASLGRSWMDFKAWVWVDSEPIIMLFALRSVWKIVVEEGEEMAMAERTHHVQECRHEGLTHWQNVGGICTERPDFEGEDPRETWF